MLPSAICGPAQPLHLYPRLRTLSRPGASGPSPHRNTHPLTAFCSYKTGSIKWALHFHKPSKEYTTLQQRIHSTSAHSAPFDISSPRFYTKAAMTSTKEPVLRTASPYIDPNVQGPRAQILAAGAQADLRKSTSYSTWILFLPSFPFLSVLSCPPCLFTDIWLYSDCQHRQQDWPSPQWCTVSLDSLSPDPSTHGHSRLTSSLSTGLTLTIPS